MQKNRLFVGNPGVGKSTIINCLVGKVLFQSGISIGGGLTNQLDKKNHNGIVYMDTPGLADIKLRQKAAKAIKEALTQTGSYQIFFVLTLEAGRLRPEDVATIKLILDSAKEITAFSLIINKVSKRMETELSQNNKQRLIQLITEADIACSSNVKTPECFILKRQEGLEDAKNSVASIDGINKFVESAPAVNVHPPNVNDIPTHAYNGTFSSLEAEIQKMRNDNAAMQRRIEETDRKCRNLNGRPLQELAILEAFFGSLGPVAGPVIGLVAEPIFKPLQKLFRF